jgi:TolA-binding protein
MKEKTFFGFFFVLLLLTLFLLRDLAAKNSTEEQKLLKVGIGAFKDGFDQIAAKQFSQFLTDYPNHPKSQEIRYLLGKTFLNTGKWKETRTTFLTILQENKDFESTDYALFWLAVAEVKLGNGEAARKALLSLVQRFPKFDWLDYAYYLLGHLDLRYRPSQAESSFKKASLISKHQELIRSSYFWLGTLSYKQKYYEAAVGYFQKVGGDPAWTSQEYSKYALFWLAEVQLKLGQWKESRTSYRTFFERFPNDSLAPEVYWRIGLCEYRLGNQKEAIDVFQSFRKQYKGSPLLSYTQHLLGEILLTRGDIPLSIGELDAAFNASQGNLWWGISALALYWSYIHQGNLEEANKVSQKLQKATHYEDEKIFIQWLNAQMVFSEGRISDALPYYFNILNTPLRERALLQIGKGYFEDNKFRESITNLDILLLEFPNSRYLEESLYIKGKSLIQLGDLTQASATFDSLFKRKNNSLWQLFALAETGSLALARHEIDRAERTFKRVTEVFPDHPLASHATLQLGLLSFKKGKLGEALTYFSAVLKGRFKDFFGKAYFGLGETFYLQGKYERAFASFEAAMGHLDESSLYFFLAQLEIGNLQKRWGKYEEAKKAYQKASDGSKDQEIKKAAQELLKLIEPQ